MKKQQPQQEVEGESGDWFIFALIFNLGDSSLQDQSRSVLSLSLSLGDLELWKPAGTSEYKQFRFFLQI